MAITTANTSAALKSYYLSAVADQLKMCSNPFFNRIRYSSENILGREVKKLIRVGMNGSVGVGSEDGDLPAAKGNKYYVFSQYLKNLYGTIEISDKALRTSSTDQGAFVNLLNEEMETLVRSASYNLSRMLFGSGSGYLGKIVSTSGKECTMDDVIAFTENMVCDLCDTGGSFSERGLVVQSVDRDKKTVVFDKTLSSVENFTLYAGGSKNIELTGLESIFLGGSIYGLVRNNNAWLVPYTKTVETLTEAEMQLAIDAVEERSGGKINFIMCSWGVRRALIDLLKADRSVVQTIDLEGGYKALSFNGIPVVVDRFCPKGRMYFLNTDDFVMHQLCDWEWLEDEDGKILKQVPGKAVFSATLVKYAELMCYRPCGQAMLQGITEK